MTGIQPGPGGDIQPEITTDKMACDLLRLALDPATGKIHGHRELDVCLRAAIFCDLILAGAVRNDDGAPRSDDPAAAGADALLRSMADAVAARPGVRWRRWFTHVDTDRTGLAKQLLADGVWTKSTDGSKRFTDRDPESVKLLKKQLTAVLQFARGPRSAREIALAYLLDLLGGARPKAVHQRWGPVLRPALDSGDTAGEIGSSMLACLGAANVSRRPRGFFHR